MPLIPLSALYMGLNFTVSVLIIWVNKFCYNRGFKWNTCMTALHFLITFIGLHISSTFFGLFQIPDKKKVSYRRVLPISLAFIGFVVFNNLSLQYNAVGVYQLLKVLTTPVVVFIGVFLHGQRIPGLQIAALLPTCIGVILATVTHLEANALGLFFGSLGIFATSFYQIWVKTEQTSLSVSAPQLLYTQSFVSFWLLLFLCPFVEDVYGGPDSLLTGKWYMDMTGIKGSSSGGGWFGSSGGSNSSRGSASLFQSLKNSIQNPLVSHIFPNIEGLLQLPKASLSKSVPIVAFFSIFDTIDKTLGLNPGHELILMVLFSGILAFLVNLSIFLVIGRTDAVSYNVLGHAKLCCILISGYVVFGEVATTKNIIGVSLAVFGIISYTNLKIKEAEMNKRKDAMKNTSNALNAYYNTVTKKGDGGGLIVNQSNSSGSKKNL